MSRLLKLLLGRKEESFTVSAQELITEACDGKDLVDGKPAWAYAEEKKHDLDYMMRCAEAELEVMRGAGVVAAPYYFERVAILLRKQKRYADEIGVCENYIAAIETFYEGKDMRAFADVRKGPRFRAIVHRVRKARQLLDKSAQ